MLDKDPNKRITPSNALDHPWFKQAKEHTVADQSDYEDAIKRLRGFHGASKLKRAAINIMVKQMSEDKHEKMRKVFQSVDKDHSGGINKDELTKALEASKLDASKEKVDSMVTSIDFSKDDIINYTEFLAATVDPKILQDETRIRGVFNLFDIDNTGYIDAPELI